MPYRAARYARFVKLILYVPIAPDELLGPYKILEPIGAGGMGMVWRAWDSRLGRPVAIKQLTEQHRSQFLREAEGNRCPQPSEYLHPV